MKFRYKFVIALTLPAVVALISLNAYGKGTLTATLCPTEQTQERQRDIVVRNTANFLLTKNRLNEQGAVIVRDPFTNAISSIGDVEGTPDRIELEQFTQLFNGTFFNYGDVVAIVHTHPRSTQTDPVGADLSNRRNRAPSINDFDAIENTAPTNPIDIEEFVVLSGRNLNSWRSEFSHFIIDYNGILREFDNTEVASGPIIRYGAIYPKNNFYDLEAFGSTMESVISKLWARFTQTDAQGVC